MTEINFENDKTILDEIGHILDLSKENGIDTDFFENANIHLDFVAEKLHISHLQSALFSHILDSSLLNQGGFRQEGSLLSSLKCTKCEYLKYLNEIDELVKMNYVSKLMDKKAMSRYTIPRDIIYALRKNMEIKPINYKNISAEKLFNRLDYLFKARYNDELTLDELFDELSGLFQDNQHLMFTKKLFSYNLDETDRVLLIYFCDKEINCKETVDFSHIEKHFSDISDKEVSDSIIFSLKSEEHILQKLELIENTNDNGFCKKEEFCLTDKAIDELLSEVKTEIIPNKKDFILSSGIKEKQMYYNSTECEQISKLTSLLLPENFKGIQKRLAEQGLRTGFACLFSGEPGTGKTETVYQIAKKTGRDLLQVDASQIKSMWVGGSEKNIKALFDRYRRYVKKLENTPILFFNEADAIIGKRMEFNSNSRSVDQMENTVQNIILQEMENLDGILIATTNLTKNMDSAFERRFLYKIIFNKPEKEIRHFIWKSMLSGIDENEFGLLADRYNFSGGQIENIVRKKIVDATLYGIEPDLSKVISYCEEEINGNKTERQIGFVA